MFKIFKKLSGAAEIKTRPVSLAQSSPEPATQCDASDQTLLDLLTHLSRANGMSAVQYGARLAVMGELQVSVLMHLPAAMRADIVKSFRERIEDLMSLSDDRSLPEQYHSALLAEVNRYLNALR